jgi:hypothetical protein
MDGGCGVEDHSYSLKSKSKFYFFSSLLVKLYLDRFIGLISIRLGSPYSLE